MATHTICTQGERDSAIGLLGLHLKAQHLIRAEYYLRAQAAREATTVDQLNRLFADLFTMEPSALPVRCTRADRDKIADVLSRHYAAGSLDEAEFADRMDKAMRAVYEGDLIVLCDDLPVLPSERIDPVQDRELWVWPHKPPKRLANAPYRTWSSEDWATQNTLAFMATAGAFILGSFNSPLMLVISMLFCSVINGLLGIRKSRRLAFFGALTGLLAFCGTFVMIMLTLRWKTTCEDRLDGRSRKLWWLSIDHSHSCCPPTYGCRKCIRGLLCANCNVMLGFAEKVGLAESHFTEYMGRRPLLVGGGDA